jgi:phosphatidylinositol dimannoside acyltransferase
VTATVRAPAEPAPGSDVRGTPGQRFRGAILAAGSWLLCHLPDGVVARIADLGGWLWYRTTPDRAAQARRNLLRVATYLDSQGRGEERVRAAAHDRRALERLVRDAYRHAARYYLDVARLPAVTARTFHERLLIETPEAVEEAFGQPRPLIFVAMHFGAIELPGVYLVERTGQTATVPMETLGDPELQRWFIRSRGRVGLRIVGLKEARRAMVDALARGEPVGMVGDRDLTGGGVEVPFFGAPASLPIGPALLAMESGSPVYVCAVRRAGTGRYRGKLIAVPVPAEGTRRERVTGMLTGLARIFETAIADAPEQWWTLFFPIWPDIEAKARAGAPPAAKAAA